MNTLHRYFEPIVRRQRRKNRWIGAGMCVLGGVAAAVGLWGGVADQELAGRLVLGAVVVPVALIVLLVSVLPSRALAALSDPSRIVWYYGVMKGGRVNAVMVGLDDGKLHRLYLPLISFKKGFSQEAFAHLRACAPHATVGFTEERRKAFRADPHALRA